MNNNKFDEIRREKYQELVLTLEDYRNNVIYYHNKIIAVNLKKTKLIQEQIFSNRCAMERLNKLNKKNTHLESTVEIENNTKNFYLDERNKLKNKLMKDIILSQTEQEEKNTAHIKQELVELDVENQSIKSNYNEYKKEYNNLYSLVHNCKLSADKWSFDLSFENIKFLK